MTGLYQGISFHATNDQEKEEIVNVFPQSKVFVIANLPPNIKKEFVPLIKEVGALKLICIGRVHPIKNTLRQY